MTELSVLRGELDVIDKQIVELYEKRMAVCEKVAEYKIQTGKKVFDKEREDAKIAALTALTDSDFNSHAIEELFRQIMSISRKRQYQLLAREGVIGRLPFTQVESDALEAISEGMADFAVLPIEKSTAGFVSEIYDLLLKYDDYIVGEQIIRIEHTLLGLPGTKLSDIKTVCSHEQGLMQCEEFLNEHRDWQQVAVDNTAMAAKKVAKEQDASQAAIASAFAGEVFGLEVLKEHISTTKGNSTRFIIVSNQRIFEKDANKISICFETPHRSGALYHILSHFIYNNLNMSKIESRPIPERNWEYRFFVDVEGNLNDSAVKNALRGITEEAANVKILGNYCGGKI